jgi:phage head maturation protease
MQAMHVESRHGVAARTAWRILGAAMTITGHPLVFGPFESQNLGGFTESIHPKALDKVLASNADIVALYSHEHSKPLDQVGRWSRRTCPPLLVPRSRLPCSS